MARVTFLPAHITVEAATGSAILDAARSAGVTIESPCNGSGTCGKCRVTLIDTTAVAGAQASGNESGAVTVLACQTHVLRDMVVELSAHWKKESVRVLETGAPAVVGFDPFITKELSGPGNETIVRAGGREIAREPGDTTSSLFGVVVDIGTTTLVATLLDLARGEEVASLSALNPQSLHGQDVLSRIKLASMPDGLAHLHGLFLSEIERMTGELVARAGTVRENIYEVVYSGNTAMLHLATNTNPSSLGKYPYTPALRGGTSLEARPYEGLHIAPSALIYLPPIISGFVGADITSGMLATRLHRRKETTLFVDIGTNGEMVIAHDGRLVASSTAAGPAFEGMNITFGMRASTGAVESFEVTEAGDVRIGTIGRSEVKGVCGSGLLDIVGELVTGKIIDGSGRLKTDINGTAPGSLKARVALHNGKPVFRLYDGVHLSQQDVRQVQLAKAAIRTGVEYLLRETMLTAADVDKILIAGAFGYHLREKSLLAIGLLPAAFEGRIEFVGNTSKTGGMAFLLDKETRAEIKDVVSSVQTVELASYKDFDRTFVDFLRF